MFAFRNARNFTTNGTYNIAIYAEDTEGNIS